MKISKLTLLILVLLSTSSFSQKSEWIDKGKYLERNASDRAIDFVKISNDSKYIYTISGYDLSIWNLETGTLVKKHNFKPSNLAYNDIAYYAGVCDDDSTIVIVEGIYYQANYSIRYSVHNINSDSLIFEYYPFKNKQICSYPHNPSSLYSVSDYNFKKRILHASYIYTRYCDGSTVHWDDIGQTFDLDFSSDTLKFTQISDQPIRWLFKTNNTTIVLTRLYSATYNYWDKPQGHYTVSCQLDYRDSSNKIIKKLFEASNQDGNNPYYKEIPRLFLNKEKKIMTTYFSTGDLIFWDVKSLQKIDSIKFKNKPVDFNLSVNLQYIVSGHNNGIYVFNKKMESIDSIPFQYETGYNWKIATSPDTVSFVFGDYSGTLRLYRSSVFTGIETPYKDQFNFELNNSFSISPNPATDFIEIQNPENRAIEIVNVFGQIQTTPQWASPLLRNRDTPPYQGGEIVKIDVSGLMPGMYFVRIGNKVGKFVKI